MKRCFRPAMMLFFAVCAIQAAGAATIAIDYEVKYITGNTWQYNYTIYNNSEYEIDLFQIYFDFGRQNDPLALYDDVVFVSAPYGWEVEILNPISYTDINMGITMFLEPWTLLAYAVEDALPPYAGPLGVFSVAFNWFGGDENPYPYGGQFFEVFGAGHELELVVSSGNTPGSPSEVPEPQTFMLLGTGLLGLAAYYRRKQARKSEKR